MLLKLTHETNLSYSDLISESVMELRMTPRQEADQHRLSFSLAIGPQTSVTSYFDWLGNNVHTFSVSAFHRAIKIIATSVVETDRAEAEPERFIDRWPLAPDAYDYSAYDFLQFGGPVVDAPGLRELITVIQPQEGMPLGEIALQMLYLIDARFQYKTGITTATSPITDLLEHRKGVCQDFAHLMLALARAMKIPARYVSGLVHPGEQSRFRGFTQTHAWCELLFPTAGWIGFDPTNRCLVGPNFVKVAVGRDYRDVAPNRGLYRGGAEETIDVQVKSEELHGVPPELAAERVHNLDVPYYLDGSVAHRELIAQQQQVQQQ